MKKIGKVNFKQVETNDGLTSFTTGVPEGWKNYNLVDIVDIKHGFAFKGEFFSDDPTGDILLTPGNFNIGGGFKDDKFKYYRGDYPQDYVLKAGDIIVTMTDLSKNGDTLGYPAKVPNSKGKKYLHNQRLGLVILKDKNIDRDFLYWLMRDKKYQRFVVNSASGSTVKHTSPNRIREFCFLASQNTNEQHAIAKILSDLDEKIELNRQMNKTLESIAQAIFKRWFVDFEFPGYEKAKFVNSLPEGWRHDVLGEIISIQSGKRPGRKSETKTKDFTISLIGASSVMGFVKDALYNEPILIIGRVGTHGVVQRVSWSSFPSDNTLVIRSKYFEFVYQILKTIDYEALNVGTTQPLITQTAINKYGIVIPSDETLERFEAYVSGLFKKVVVNNRENESLVEIRDSLLPRLMSGKIRITV